VTTNVTTDRENTVGIVTNAARVVAMAGAKSRRQDDTGRPRIVVARKREDVGHPRRIRHLRRRHLRRRRAAAVVAVAARRHLPIHPIIAKDPRGVDPNTSPNRDPPNQNTKTTTTLKQQLHRHQQQQSYRTKNSYRNYPAATKHSRNGRNDAPNVVRRASRRDSVTLPRTIRFGIRIYTRRSPGRRGRRRS